MKHTLNIEGFFETEEELREMIKKRRICYDTEPYYITKKGGELLQIGYQINLYGTFPAGDADGTPDDVLFRDVRHDVRMLAEVLSNTCDPLHICDTTITDSSSVSYAPERRMRPDVTVHIPVFDQENFGRPVDAKVTEILHMAAELLEDAGVRKNRWVE